MMKHLFLVPLSVAVACSLSLSANADIVSGTITNWPESGAVLQIGDGTNHVSIWWSINTANKGWFYGSNFTGDSNVSAQPGVTDISEITFAEGFSYTAGSVGPLQDSNADPDMVGDFVVWQNLNTGHFGALRIDDIIGNDVSAVMNATWWFQTNGTGNFAVPEPSSVIAIGLLAICSAGMRRRRAA